MATAFTAITDGLDWQDVDFVNEIVDAYSERRQAAGYSSMSSIAAGADIQAASFWSAMQDGIDTSITAGKWVDPDTSPFTGDAAIPVYDLATFYADAGMDAYGWRRATAWNPGAVDGTWQNDVTFYYGPMQAGDIIGPWIFDDLQKAISELKWTTRSDGTNTDGGYKSQFVGAPAISCAAARSIHLSSWPASWTNGATYLYLSYGYLRIFGGGYTAAGWRYKGKPHIASVWTGVNHSSDLYLLPSVFDPFGGAIYEDIDGFGWNDTELVLYESFLSGASATHTAAIIDPSNNSPVADAPISCPISSDDNRGILVNDHWVFQWSFTTSN